MIFMMNIFRNDIQVQYVFKVKSDYKWKENIEVDCVEMTYHLIPTKKKEFQSVKFYP